MEQGHKETGRFFQTRKQRPRGVNRVSPHHFPIVHDGRRRRTAPCRRAPASAFALWMFLHRPRWIRPPARKFFENSVQVEDLPKLKAIPKSRFLKSVKITRG